MICVRSAEDGRETGQLEVVGTVPIAGGGGGDDWQGSSPLIVTARRHRRQGITVECFQSLW